jgi:hypothetical protein
VKNAWEKMKKDVLRDVEGEERGIKLSQEEVGDIVHKFFDDKFGWQDRPCHLTR